MFIFVFICLFSSSQSSRDCPQYACKLSSQTFASQTCIFYTDPQSIQTYYTTPCDRDSITPYCNIVSYSNSTCTAAPTPSSYPGDPCDKETPCNLQNECINSTCTANDITLPCESHMDCDQGLFCSSENTCASQLEIGESGCRDDFDCINSAGCNKTSDDLSICLGYFTLNNYEAVGSCEDYKNQLCISGYCAGNQGGSFCYSEAQNNRPSPYVCEDNEDCRSYPDKEFFDISIEGECDCGLNSHRTKVCSLFYYDPEAKGYFSLLNDWMTGEAIRNCHTLARMDFSCMKRNWEDSNLFIYKYYKATAYQYYYYAKDCVLKVMMPDYYYLRKEYESAVHLMIFWTFWVV